MNWQTRLGTAALGVLLFGAHEIRAGEMIPLKVKFIFRVDVSTHHHPAPSHPWWMYFPHDPHLMQPASGPTFPHWPAPQPQATSARPPIPAGTPNIAWHAPVLQPLAQPAYGQAHGQPMFAQPMFAQPMLTQPTAVLPASYRQGIWFDR